ncbi:hypothetical protein [Lacrimispora sp. 38-1]|uniref:hypothetical protein n=1 Tax=Lacrimispora sp. 38-1 TaxID=3125778 RepID=UPI003CFB4592
MIYRESGRAVWSSDTWIEALQASSSGSWFFAYDEPDDIRIENPPNTEILTSSKKSFAVGDVEAKLVKGGPTGAYIYAHFHGIHEGVGGDTLYKVGIVVRGKKDGYCYLVVPRMETTVSGVSDRQERHRHGKILFTLPAGKDADIFRDAISKGTEMEILIIGTRNKKELFSDIIDKIPPELKKIFIDIIIEYLSKYTDDVIKTIAAFNSKR